MSTETAVAVETPVQAPQASVEGAEAPKAAEPAKQPVSKSFLALARAAKNIAKQKQEQKLYEQKLQQREQSLSQRGQSKPQTPIEALMAAGYTYEDATNFILNDQKPTAEMEIKSMKQQFAEWQQRQEAERQRIIGIQRQKVQAEINESIQEYRNKLDGFVNSQPDAYELINRNAEENTQLIYELVEENFKRTNKILSMKEAADRVESFLEEEIESAAQSKKIQAKLAAKAQTQKEQTPEKSQGFSAQSAKTLSNNLTSSAMPSSLSNKTENDRIARALAKLQGG